MRPSSVHSLHCLEPRSYWSPRKTFRYCNRYFIQRPVDARTEREAGVGTIICCKEPAYLLMMAGYGSCFFSLFVCLYVCSFKDQGKVVAHNDNVAGKKRAIPRGKIDLSCPLGQPIRTRDTFPLLCPLAKGRVKEHKLSQNCFLVKAVLVLHVPQCHISS